MPIDDAIKKKGITLASRCCCCVQPTSETIHHLFITSDMARSVWQHFSRHLQLPFYITSIQHLISIWLARTNRRSQLGEMILGCLFYGFWEIWKALCRIKFDEATPNIHSLIKRIYTHVYELSLQVTPKRVVSTWESTILESKNIPVRCTKVKRGRWLLWSKPTMGMVKMNTDNSCKG